MVADNDGQMDVLAGNFVTADEAEMLSERVDFLQQKSPEELRSLYREKLRQPPDDTSKGASLGLIEIARRSSLPLTCDAFEAEDGLYFFMIKATV